MANRCLLHRKKLEALKGWLTKEGWELYPCKGESEVLRAKKDEKWFIVFGKQDASTHLSVRNEDVKFVRRFLKGIKNGANQRKAD